MLLKGQAEAKKSRRCNGKSSSLIKSSRAAAAGSSAATGVGVSPSAVAGASLRSSSATRLSSSSNTSSSSGNGSPPASSRPSSAACTRSRVNQQQQQGPQRHHSQARIPSTLNSAVGALRGSDEQLGGARQSANTNSQQDICDNSNDSGLGFEERQQQHLNKAAAWNGGAAALGEEDTKRRKMDIKLESEDANFAFPEVVQGTQSEGKISARNGIVSGRNGSGVNGSVGRVVGVTRPRPHLGVLSKRAPPAHQGPITLTSQLCSVSRNGKVQLQIVCQPEQQHRARYQTEGSRGAVKDRTGNGFPIVRLVGYDKPTTLQVFIGTDLGRVAPHMFYQACRVSGKNSTPCVERKLDGTIVIEVDMDPSKEMIVTCDCVGILKERNVDVEHRFPQEAGILQGRSKKKSTRCRMVFRTTITHDEGTTETLQVCSQPIVCTQPPGIPEICKKSLTSCPCTGGLELFILGKNFLKDTRVLFKLDNDDLNLSLEPHWECTVLPDKEFLQQTHLVCVVPAYRRQDLAPSETISIKLFAISSGKTSEPHSFLYTSTTSPPTPSVGKLENTSTGLLGNGEAVLGSKLSSSPLVVPGNVTSPALLPASAGSAVSFMGAIPAPTPAVNTATAVSPESVLKSDPSPPPVTAATPVTPVMMWSAQTAGSQSNSADVMMPPPPNMVANPLMTRRSSSSLQLILPDNLKTEVLDENSQSSLMGGDNSMSGMPSAAATAVASPLEQLVNENSRDSSQNSLIRGSLPTNSSPVQDALLGVVDLIRTQHPMNIVPQQSPFNGLHESSQVKVLSPHHINKDNSPIMASETSNMSPGVVDLRMKHHQSSAETFNGIGNTNLGSFAATPVDQPLPAQSGQSIEKYLHQIESTSKKNEIQDANFVRASIIAGGQQQNPSLLSPVSTTVPLDELVNSAVESHQMVSPLRTTNSSPNDIINHVAAVVEHETIPSPQQPTRTSPSGMLLEVLMPNATVSPLSVENTAVPNGPVTVTESTTDETLLKTINAALLPAIQESPIVSSTTTDISPSVSVSDPMQVTNEVISPNVPMQVTNEVISPNVAMQVLAQDTVAMQQQVQQVEQVVAQAAQQVEQVVAQAQQQAVQAVQQAQQQVVQQVVQHAHVVQQAVQKVHAVQHHAPAASAIQQAVQQATQEVVQQAVQQATHEVVQQVQAVQQAVQQAQAAQAMQHAVQQDIGSMLNQPAGFVAEASSALASGAAHEPSQQRLTTAAEQAINNVITNATHDIINNRPITTTTAHAIIATKNILNSVATQSAQLMNSAMEVILPKSPAAQQNMVDQVTVSKSPPTVPVPMQTGPGNAIPSPPVVNQPTPMQQNNEPPASTVPSQQVSQQNTETVRKSDGNSQATSGMMTQDLMTDHELLSYINASCFDPQNAFLM